MYNITLMTGEMEASNCLSKKVSVNLHQNGW